MWCTGLVSLRHVESSPIRNRTGVLCIARWILNHRTTRETPPCSFFCTICSSKVAFCSFRKSPSSLFLPCHRLPQDSWSFFRIIGAPRLTALCTSSSKTVLERHLSYLGLFAQGTYLHANIDQAHRGCWLVTASNAAAQSLISSANTSY